jgi:hypothetical protein
MMINKKAFDAAIDQWRIADRALDILADANVKLHKELGRERTAAEIKKTALELGMEAYEEE